LISRAASSIVGAVALHCQHLIHALVARLLRLTDERERSSAAIEQDRSRSAADDCVQHNPFGAKASVCALKQHPSWI
jgi:hypothetical protein